MLVNRLNFTAHSLLFNNVLSSERRKEINNKFMNVMQQKDALSPVGVDSREVLSPKVKKQVTFSDVIETVCIESREKMCLNKTYASLFHYPDERHATENRHRDMMNREVQRCKEKLVERGLESVNSTTAARVLYQPKSTKPEILMVEID